MTGYIIGLLLGIIVFLWQNFKPTSVGFRYMYIIVSVAFMWGIYYAHLGWWNVLIIPIGMLVLCFISAFCFPYMINSARTEYSYVNGHNYYIELKDTDYIGKIDCPGFKQTYDRIMGGIIVDTVMTQDDSERLWNLLYSKNFYPISEHTKQEIMQHITSSIETVAVASKHRDVIRKNAQKNIELFFNTFVSVMSIHEEATRNLEEIRAKQQEYERQL